MRIKITGNNYLVDNGDKNLKLASNQIVQKHLCHPILEELKKKTGRQSLKKSKEIMKEMCQRHSLGTPMYVYVPFSIKLGETRTWSF